MATITFENIAQAFAHLTVIRQATSDIEIRTLCDTACSTIAAEVDEIVILDGIDPAAELQKIKFDPFYAAIDECNSIADLSTSPTVKAGCLSIVESLNNVMHKLI